MTTITIGDRQVGPEQPVFIVAELSCNHRQDYERATALVRAAAEAGADAIKLQTFTPEGIAAPGYVIESGLWRGRELRELYAEAMTPWEWHEPLFELAHELGLIGFSSPFSEAAADFLDHIGVPCFKIASFELVDLPLIRHAASKGKPLILSTGMASYREIMEALGWVDQTKGNRIALLHCVSAYTAQPSEANLETIPALSAQLGHPVGLSDHTPGIAVPVAAVALGACIIEKHLKLPGDWTLDADFSVEPAEFRAMVDAVRVAEQAVGAPHYGPTAGEYESLKLRRSLWVVEDMVAGEVFTPDKVHSLRPADGLAPRHWDEVMGKVARCDIKAGTALRWEWVR